MDICEWVRVGVPATKAEIETANTRKVIVDHDDLK
jgi:hypothetical protein